MLEFLWNIALVIMQLLELLAIALIFPFTIALLFMAWRALFRCNLTVARLYDYRYVETERTERDYANDRYETRYEGEWYEKERRVEYHTKAYKQVYTRKHKSVYHYFVDGNEYFAKSTDDVKCQGFQRMAPDSMRELYYLRKKPYRNFFKETYKELIKSEIDLITTYIVVNLITKLFEIPWYGYVFYVFIYIILFILSYNAKRTRPTY